MTPTPPASSIVDYAAREGARAGAIAAIEALAEEQCIMPAQAQRILARLAQPPAPPQPVKQDGIALIAAERKRQVEQEGWTAEHDDEHANQEMAMAAACYADPTEIDGVPNAWPWDEKWWKPTPDNRIRELVKAGALIAAEIDRLQRLSAPPQPVSETSFPIMSQAEWDQTLATAAKLQEESAAAPAAPAPAAREQESMATADYIFTYTADSDYGKSEREAYDAGYAAARAQGRAEAAKLVAELENIANADPSKWEPAMRDQFQQWAQSRARAAALAALPAPPSEAATTEGGG